MNDKGVRIHDLARRLAVPTRELISFLEKKGITLDAHTSSIDGPTSEMLLQAFGAKGVRSQKADTPKPPRKPLGRTFTPPKPGSLKREQPVRRAPQQHAQKPSADEAKPRETPPAKTSAKPDGARTKEQQHPKRNTPVGLQDAKTQTRQPAKPGRAFEPPKEGSGTHSRQPARHGHTFEPPKQDSESKSRQPIKRGRTFTPPQSDARTPGAEKTAGRGSGKKQEFVRKGSNAEADTGANKKRPVSRKPSTQKKPFVKNQDEQSAKPTGTARKPGKTTDGRQPAKPTTAYRPQTKRTPEAGGGSATGNRRPAAGRRPNRQARSSVATPRVPVAPPPPVEEKPKRVTIPENIMLKDLADQMAIHPAQIIRHLMEKGILANVNQMLQADAAKSIAESFEFEVEEQRIDDVDEEPKEVVDESTLQPRPPVVTIMGHVDHGKTTLLDAIRESKVADSEFGGITQHIGAYVVDMNEHKVVFLDTPGHEAFTAMRARGAQVTDAVILVVAADDGIMPQTIEAIDHAKAAEVPIIVAINKMDLPGANPDRVMQELTKYGLTPEDWGGETICVQVSAKQQTNLDTLLEMILLQAEMLELKANPDCPAKGVVVEAMLDKGRGPVATVLMQSGTLRIGDAFVAGIYHGKVRAMFDDRGNPVKASGPSMPVEVLGITGIPIAGDDFAVVDSDRNARQIAEKRQSLQQKNTFLKSGKITLEELHNHIKDGSIEELRIVIKADVHGSVEALSDALARLSTEQVRLQVIHGGVGAINETDVMLAAAESNAIILGFNVRPVAKAREMAEKEQIDMRLYTIIYQAIEDIKKAMEGLLKPTYKEVLQGQANVQATFSVPKIGVVAGCRVVHGKVTRNSIVKLYRDHKEVYKGTIASLRRVKDDVREVTNGYECGINLENYNDIKEGDIIESYTLETIVMTLEEAARKKE